MPFSAILNAFAREIPLPKIITTFNLSPDDLHAFLSTPGISGRLEALRALLRFDQDLRTIHGQNEATDFLRAYLKDQANQAEGKRRAATALLRGPGIPRGTGVPPVSRSRNPDRKEGARPDIADWGVPPPDDIDAEDDADLDDDDVRDAESAPAHPRPVLTGRGVRGPSEGETRTERGVPVSVRSSPPASLTNPTPDQLIAHQLSLIAPLQDPTPRDIVHAIDYHGLSFPIRACADLALAFARQLENNPILDLTDAEVTPEPAIINPDATPPTATVRVLIKHPGGRTAAARFHLIHESTFPSDPAAPHAWHTQAITADDTS